MNLYQVIKKLAVKKDLSIAQLERECGLSSASISKWAVSVPSADKLYLVAKHLGVNVQYLLENIKMEGEQT